MVLCNGETCLDHLRSNDTIVYCHRLFPVDCALEWNAQSPILFTSSTKEYLVSHVKQPLFLN